MMRSLIGWDSLLMMARSGRWTRPLPPWRRWRSFSRTGSKCRPRPMTSSGTRPYSSQLTGTYERLLKESNRPSLPRLPGGSVVTGFQGFHIAAVFFCSLVASTLIGRAAVTAGQALDQRGDRRADLEQGDAQAVPPSRRAQDPSNRCPGPGPPQMGQHTANAQWATVLGTVLRRPPQMVQHTVVQHTANTQPRFLAQYCAPSAHFDWWAMLVQRLAGLNEYLLNTF